MKEHREQTRRQQEKGREGGGAADDAVGLFRRRGRRQRLVVRVLGERRGDLEPRLRHADHQRVAEPARPHDPRRAGGAAAAVSAPTSAHAIERRRVEQGGGVGDFTGAGAPRESMKNIRFCAIWWNVDLSLIHI